MKASFYSHPVVLLKKTINRGYMSYCCLLLVCSFEASSLDMTYTCIMCRKIDYFSLKLSLCSSEERKSYTYGIGIKV